MSAEKSYVYLKEMQSEVFLNLKKYLVEASINGLISFVIEEIDSIEFMIGGWRFFIEAETYLSSRMIHYKTSLIRRNRQSYPFYGLEHIDTLDITLAYSTYTNFDKPKTTKVKAKIGEDVEAPIAKIPFDQFGEIYIEQCVKYLYENEQTLMQSGL